MTKNPKLLGSAGVYLGANILNAGIPFLLLPILTRVLSPADYGIIAMFTVILGFFGAFSGLSVHGAISVRYFQLEKKEFSEFVTTCLIILVSSTTLVFIIVGLIGNFITEATSVPHDWLLVGVIVSAGQILGNIRLALWQVVGQPIKFGAFLISQSLSNAAISLLLILVVGFAWQGRLLGQSIAFTLFGAIAIWWLWKDGFILKPTKFKAQASDALHFGIPMIPHVIGGLLIVAVDRFVIVELLDVARAGIYMVALQLGQVLGLLTDSFNKAYSPWLMGRLSQKDDIPRLAIVRGTYLYFIVVLSIAILVGLTATVAVRVLAGSAFQSASDLVPYIALGFAFSGCYLMVTNYIFYESKTKYLACVTIAAGLLNVGLTVFLVKRNGLVGAAQAFMITQLLSFLGTWWLSNRVHPMPWFSAVLPTSTQIDKA